jgi:hypothetical protein
MSRQNLVSPTIFSRSLPVHERGTPRYVQTLSGSDGATFSQSVAKPRVAYAGHRTCG